MKILRKNLNKLALINLFIYLFVKKNEWKITNMIFAFVTVVSEIFIAAAIMTSYTIKLVKITALLGSLVASIILGVFFSIVVVKILLLLLKSATNFYKWSLKFFKLSPQEIMQKLAVLGCEPTGKQSPKIVIIEYNNLFGQRIQIVGNEDKLFSDSNIYSIRVDKEVNDIEKFLQERRLAERFSNIVAAIQ